VTPKGFDHMIQATIVDRDGVVYRQVYGQQIEPPQFVDPLRRLALGQKAEEDTLGAMIEGVRLFCTVFDPRSGRYRFDWSIVLSFVIGVLCFTAVAAFLWRSWFRTA
jgi:protein SCO1/2